MNPIHSLCRSFPTQFARMQISSHCTHLDNYSHTTLLKNHVFRNSFKNFLLRGVFVENLIEIEIEGFSETRHRV